MESAGRELTDEAQREAMKASGLGTRPPRAGIIELLIARRYVERQDKFLVPTAKGWRCTISSVGCGLPMWR